MRAGFRTRLTVWHGIAVAAILAVTALVADRALVRAVGDQVDGALLALAETEAASALDGDDGAVHVHEGRPGDDDTPPSRLDKLVQVVSADGAVVGRSARLSGGGLPVGPGLLARLAEGKPVFETVDDAAGEPLRMASLPLELDGRLRYAVQVATPLGPSLAVLRTARLLFAGAAVAILAAVVATGALLARRALAPIDEVVAQARRIGESSLSARLPHPGTADEIGRLVTTLNEMLARIERGVEAQRRFTADASHELRSPLSRLRTELEVALRRPRPAEAYETALRSSLEEVERLTRLTSALLTLARLDAGEPPADPEPVAVGPVAEAEVRRLAPEAARRGVALVLEPPPPVVVRVGRDALAVVLGNLLDNALKFSPPGGRVAVRVSAEEGHGRVAVADQGPGVPPADRPHVFDRFFRGDPSRTPGAPGVGLGLAIARAFAEAYGGRLAVADTPGGGATFTVDLPATA